MKHSPSVSIEVFSVFSVIDLIGLLTVPPITGRPIANDPPPENQPAEQVRAMSKKYPLPPFLTGKIDQKAYSRWLSRRSIAHVRRDKKRGNTTALNEAYKKTSHLAAVDSAGLDEYSGEALDWSLISKWDNAESKTHRRKYKSLFALLPTVDHIDDGLGAPSFKICGWRTNDAKGDLTHAELVEFCRRVLAHSERLTPC